jgi:amidase
MATYIDWMRSCSRITVSAHPAVSIPAGLTQPRPPELGPTEPRPTASGPTEPRPTEPRPTAAGLPVGLQLVGPYGADRRLLELAAAITELLGPVAPGPLP